MPDSPKIIVLKDEAELITRLGVIVEEAAAKAIAADDVFKIGLSGKKITTRHVAGDDERIYKIPIFTALTNL